MDVYTTEQEQVETIKKWLREYGPTVLVGGAIGLAGIYGWRYWQAGENAKRVEASVAYEEVLKQLADKDKRADAAKASEALMTQHDATAYADLTAFHLAKAAVEDNKLDEAAKHLRAVVNKPEHPVLGHIARVRLARVLMAQQKGEEALALLTTNVEPGSFRPAYEEAKGDILKALGRVDEARVAYEAARSAGATGSSSERLLAMKLDDLGAQPSAAATGGAQQ